MELIREQKTNIGKPKQKRICYAQSYKGGPVTVVRRNSKGSPMVGIGIGRGICDHCHCNCHLN